MCCRISGFCECALFLLSVWIENTSPFAFSCHWPLKCILTSSLSIWQCQLCRSICFSGWIKRCTCFIISRIASLARWWWWSAQLKWFFTVWYYRQRWFSNADQVVEYVYISFDCWFILVLFVILCLICCCFTWIQGICCFGHSDLMNYNFSLSALYLFFWSSLHCCQYLRALHFVSVIKWCSLNLIY